MPQNGREQQATILPILPLFCFCFASKLHTPRLKEKRELSLFALLTIDQDDRPPFLRFMSKGISSRQQK